MSASSFENRLRAIATAMGTTATKLSDAACKPASKISAWRVAHEEAAAAAPTTPGSASGGGKKQRLE